MDEAGPRKRGPRKKEQLTQDGDDGATRLERDLMEAHRQNGGEENGMYPQMGLFNPSNDVDEYQAQAGSGDGGDTDDASKKRKRDPSEWVLSMEHLVLC